VTISVRGAGSNCGFDSSRRRDARQGHPYGGEKPRAEPPTTMTSGSPRWSRGRVSLFGKVYVHPKTRIPRAFR